MIIRGFPSSSHIQEGIRIPLECLDCKETKYETYNRTLSGEVCPRPGEPSVQICRECADKRQVLAKKEDA